MKTDSYKKAAVLVGAALLIILDQVTKFAVENELKGKGRQVMAVIPGFLEFSYLENPAAAFGLLGDVIGVVMVLTLLVTAGILAGLFWYKQHSAFSYTAAALLLAGGLGNLIDRITRGYVVDFIHVEFFHYIFNVADCCVTVGACFLVLHYLLITHREKRALAAVSEGPEDTETQQERE